MVTRCSTCMLFLAVTVLRHCVQNASKVVLVAHSFGTLLAVRLAAERRERVVALVLIASALPVPRPWLSMRLIFLLPSRVC